ncbi:MAG: Tic22 family protein [Pseudanabaenaceae cyanobacterium]
MVTFFVRLWVLVALLMGLALPAFALTEAQVVERLATIPIFVITDSQGIPLVGTNGEKDSDRVLPFFLNPQDAETTLRQIQSSSPELEPQILARSMRDMYNFVHSNQDKDIVYQLVPSESSLQAAAAVFGGNGEELPNVPVFFAVEMTDEQNGGLFTVSQGEQVFIPFFFEREDLDRLIAQVNANDKTDKQPQVRVVSFFQVLNSMVDTEENKAAPEVERFAFFAAQKSFDWIKANSGKGEKAAKS